MPTLDAVRRAITDENLDDLTTTAWYGGTISYWAAEVDEPNENLWFHIYEHDDYTVSESETEHRQVNGKMLKRAFWEILEGEIQVASYIRAYFRNAWDDRDDNGIDMAHIDAEAADVWVQVAAFGKIVYG